MDAQDALFEDIQTLSDEAERLGLKDVAVVLEFAMDVFLREEQQAELAQHIPSKSFDLSGTSDGKAQSWSISSFPLAQVLKKAS